MSFRTHLTLLMVALVTLIVVFVGVAHLASVVNTLWRMSFDRSELVGQQVNEFIFEYINQQARDYKTPHGVAQTKAMWREIVTIHRDIISNTLERTVALSSLIAEINVADESGEILTSSNRFRSGMALARFGSFSEWSARPFYRRVLDLVEQGANYQVAVPLGVAGQSQPFLTIQVVTSSRLLRKALRPEIETSRATMGGVFLACLLLTLGVLHRYRRAIRDVEGMIGKINSDNPDSQASTSAMAENSPFTAAEKNLIVRELKEIRDLLLDEPQSVAERLLDGQELLLYGQQAAAERIEAIDRELKYLSEASQRLGRKDWLNIMIGVISGLSMTLALEPEKVQKLYEMARTLFQVLSGGSQGHLK